MRKSFPPQMTSLFIFQVIQDADIIPNSFLTRHRKKARIALFILIVIVIIATIFGIRQMHRLQISAGATPQVIIVIILSISLLRQFFVF